MTSKKMFLNITLITASQKPGPVLVTVSTQDRRFLGMTYFKYVDEIQEVLKQVVKDPALQFLYLTMWFQEQQQHLYSPSTHADAD